MRKPLVKGQIVYVVGHGDTQFVVVGAGPKSAVLDPVVGATPGNRRWVDNPRIRLRAPRVQAQA